jgi:hypothetical protein
MVALDAVIAVAVTPEITGGMGLFTVTETLPLVPVIAAALTAAADRVCPPFVVARVLHERLYTGPAPVTVAPRFAPSSLN